MVLIARGTNHRRLLEVFNEIAQGMYASCLRVEREALHISIVATALHSDNVIPMSGGGARVGAVDTASGGLSPV